MARQPRQQRIDVYGGFTPTGVDRTAGDKMRALAGLGQQMRESTLAIGKPIIEAKRAEEGVQAAQDALEYGSELKMMSAAKFGGNQYNAAAMSTYKTGIMEDINAGLSDIATQNPSSIEDFTAKSKGFYDGIKGSVPLELQAGVEKYFGTVSRQQGASVLKAQQKIELDESKASWTVQKSLHENTILNLIASGDMEGAQELQENFNTNIVPDFIASGATDQEELATYGLKLEFDSKVAQVNGGAQQIIDDESLTVAQRKQQAKKYVDAFDAVDLAEFTPEEKKAARKELVSLFEDAEKARITELKEARLVDLETQYTNLAEYDDNILNSTVISIDQKKADINKLRIDGKIPEEDAKLRITYLNSVDKLTATTKPPIYNQLIQQSYDVLQIEDPELQLEGFKQIENAMLEAQTRGDVDFRTAESWRVSFRNLTQSAKAKSSKELYDNMIDAQETIDAMIPVSMRGEGVRYLWENAEPRIREENAERIKAKKGELSEKEVAEIYREEAQNAVDQIKTRMAVRAQTLIGKTTTPMLTNPTQAEYDALPTGTPYMYKGLQRTK
jgi:hypothetical protein